MQAYDPANTGLGGYGNNQMGTTNNFGGGSDFTNPMDDNNNLDNNMSSGTGGAFGRDRGMEKPDFQGTDSQFGNTDTGATFNRSDDLNSGNRGGLDDMQSRDRDNFDPSGPRNDQFGGETKKEREGGKPSFGDKMRGMPSLFFLKTSKLFSFSVGTAEKLAGTISGNNDLKEL